MANTETKIRRKHHWISLVIFLILVILLPAPWRVSPRAQQPQQPRPIEAQQRPVFRGGTHFVRVDAYPLKDGKIITGLQPSDFEIFEDGKPQAIDSFDFIEFATFTPDAERSDPATQREGFDRAADPRYRLFTIFVDMAFSQSTGPFAATPDLPRVQQPLINFLDRVIGPNDLYAFVTSRNSVKDLVFAQKTQSTTAAIKDLWRASVIDRDDADDALGSCGCGEIGAGKACDELIERMKQRYRADMTYSTLTDLVYQLGSLRQERKNLVFVSNQLPRWRPEPAVLERRGAQLPRAGISEGRITSDDRRTAVSGNPNTCIVEFQRLALMDFDPRYRQLLQDARRENVSFYVITPGGLQAPPDLASTREMNGAYDDLRSLAEETDGIAVVNTNDLNAGMRRIADDLAAYYVLGYYSTNTNFDGGLRNLRVRLKSTGQQIRARRQYRAPTREEIAALSASAARAAAPQGPSPVETALTVLERGSRPFAVYAAIGAQQMTVVTELSAATIQAGKWKDGADVEVEAANADGMPIAKARGRIEPGTYSAAIPMPLAAGVPPARVSVRLVSPGAPSADDWAKLPAARTTLIGDPLAYRSSSRSTPRPVAAFEFARNERIRVEWPLLAALDRREVRLLDRTGKPIPVELPLAEDSGRKQLVVEMSLSGLGRGDYLIELSAGAGSVSERGLLAIRIR
jgi:VWFA-related protein